MVSTFELSLSEDYVADWGVGEAVREIIQNAIDQSSQDPTVEYNDGKKQLIVTSDGAFLTTDSLLLGVTSKTNNSKAIGQFGEGYKLALLVLTRGGYEVTIDNGGTEQWTCRLVKSRKYMGRKVLRIFVNKKDKFLGKSKPKPYVTYTIEGISPADYEDYIKPMYRLAPYNPVESPDSFIAGSSHGRVLLSEEDKGKVFVSGLYVSTVPNLVYGYDLTPDSITLGRDRNLADSYDVSGATSNIWLDHPDHALLPDLVADQALDVSRVVAMSHQTYYNTDGSLYYTESTDALKLIADSTFRTLSNTLGRSFIAVFTQSELDYINTKYGSNVAYVVTSNQLSLLKYSEDYLEQVKQFKEVDLPAEQKLALWHERYAQFIFNDDGKEELKQILNDMGIIGNEPEEKEELPF